MTKIDLPTIIRNVADKVILLETPDIRRAFTIESSDGETILKTDGINIIVSVAAPLLTSEDRERDRGNSDATQTRFNAIFLFFSPRKCSSTTRF